MGHSHAHAVAGATASARHRGRLVAALAIALSVALVEAAIGLVSGSVALLADAAHMLGDATGLLIALVAIAVAGRRGGPQTRRTYGFHRAEVLAAGLNGLVLLVLCGVIAWQAWRRLLDPTSIDAGAALVGGVIGLVANVVGLVLLRPGASESLNVKGAYLEVLGDALGSIAVIVSAVAILATGWLRADAVASLVIAALIAPRALVLMRDVVDVLLESTPAGIDLDELRAHMARCGGVAEVHDVHVWTITSGMPVMSAHVVLADDVTELDEAQAVLCRLHACLADHFEVEHCTIQIDPPGHAATETHTHH